MQFAPLRGQLLESLAKYIGQKGMNKPSVLTRTNTLSTDVHTVNAHQNLNNRSLFLLSGYSIRDNGPAREQRLDGGSKDALWTRCGRKRNSVVDKVWKLVWTCPEINPLVVHSVQCVLHNLSRNYVNLHALFSVQSLDKI